MLFIQLVDTINECVRVNGVSPLIVFHTTNFFHRFYRNFDYLIVLSKGRSSTIRFNEMLNFR